MARVCYGHAADFDRFAWWSRRVGAAAATSSSSTTDGSAARERLHVCRVPLQRTVERHARRQASETGIRLVEAEQRVRAVVGDGEVDVGGPDGR